MWSTFPTFSAKVEPDDEEMLRQRALHLRALNLEPPGDVLSGSPVVTSQWIGLRENLHQTMVFTIKYRSFL